MAVKELRVFIVCFWIIYSAAGHEFFSSTDQIAQLYGKMKDFLKVFSQCIDAENVETMKSVLLNLLLSYSDSENHEEAIRNPVAAYRLLRQMRNDLIFIEKHIKPNLYQCEEYQDELDAKLLEIPQLEDVDGAASGLIRLQEIYKLHPEDITKETSLNADEAYHVGLVAYDEGKFQHAFLWFLDSLDRLTEYSTTTEEELLHYLSSSAYHFGSLPVAIYFGQQLLNLVINIFASDPSNDEVRVQLNWLLHLQSNPDIFTLNTESSNYEALCRGEVDERTSKRQRALSCRYSTGGGNPRLMYAPVKEEVEWDEPRIIRYHDIISDREIEILKNISRPQLSRSQIGKGTVSDFRTSQSVFLKEDYTVARINQRIADITGLSIESSEYLHVQNYGIGGRYEPHYDAWDNENERIATFLIYMSDVEIGGTTVFPKVGVALQPEKGSAVFWYNLHKSGTVDLKTEHAGCPVLMGNKWVANKWIHEYGQVFRRPCSLSDRE
ncbi:prolyl 4-hydroxylase subunit alpha-1-like isoform X1 [Ctenopharyngodon idella]|uniref:prolyl 4-hydroxylase subunit alpha-1-like isoform X1 n=1 Tax=Ctenopharyngodon idella TaxID=7959 RepID=UPI00222F74D0|nr:prolyl 4-hydroxylase subunit alpha-1-like isoform X1 [Ctenopharyngodon idella]